MLLKRALKFERCFFVCKRFLDLFQTNCRKMNDDDECKHFKTLVVR